MPRLHRHPLGNVDAGRFQLGQFARVVGHQPNRFHTKMREHLLGRLVIARIDRQSQIQIRFDGIAPLVLQLVREDLVAEPDTAPLMAAQVHNRAAARPGDARHRIVKLRAAVATQRAEHVAGQAFGMHAHQKFFLIAQLAHCHHYMFDRRGLPRAIDMDMEFAVDRRQQRGCNVVDRLFAGFFFSVSHFQFCSAGLTRLCRLAS